MKTDLFQSCGYCWVFQICWHIDCSTFTASSFRIWYSSTGIPSPPLALFVVMVPKVHLTLHSRMSGSSWVITPSWLSGSWRYMHSNGYIFPFLLCLSLLFCSQLFVRPPQTTILPFCISFLWGWSWSLPPVQCHRPPAIVLQALCLSDLIPWARKEWKHQYQRDYLWVWYCELVIEFSSLISIFT